MNNVYSIKTGKSIVGQKVNNKITCPDCGAKDFIIQLTTSKCRKCNSIYFNVHLQQIFATQNGLTK